MQSCLEGYLRETSLHGFKYLQLRSEKIIKLIWALVIAGCFAFSIYMINESVHEWNENPVITSVDSIESPLKEIDFPAITLCHEPQYQVDNWALTEVIFNFFEFGCSTSDLECKKSEMLRKDFQPYLDVIFKIITRKVDETDLDDMSLKKVIKDKYVEVVAQAVLNNVTSIEELTKVMKTSIGKFSSEVSFVRKFVQESDQKLSCDDCQELYDEARNLLFKAKVLKLSSSFGFGTLLRNFASHLGMTFDQQNVFVGRERKIQLCDEFLDTEKVFHGLMLDLGKAFGINASTHDLPAFQKIAADAKEEGEARLDYPFYTLCQYKDNDEYLDIIGNKKYLPSCITKWTHILQESNVPEKNPYVEYNGTFCSKGTANIVGSDLAKIMKVMKFAHHLQTMKDYKDFYDLLQSLNFPYTLRPFKETINEKFYKYESVRPFVLDYLGLSPTFQPVITNAGLCQAWNHQSQNEIFKDSRFLKDFHMSFNENNSNSKGLPASIKSKLIYFDKHEVYLNDRFKSDFSFWIGISNGDSFHDVNLNPTSIRRGYKTFIKVQPTAISSDDNIKKLPIDKRKCRFDFEVPHDMILFRKYSPSACRFQCMYNFSWEECMCIPWDMPKPDNAKTQICDSSGNRCFYSKMKNHTYSSESCNCYPKCETVQYSYGEKQSPIAVKRECGKSSRGFQYTASRKIANSVPFMVSAFKKLSDHDPLKGPFDVYKELNAQSMLREWCEESFMKDISIIEVQIEGQSHITMKQSLRHPISSKIGELGGTLGVFTGFSFVALVEIVYWMGLTLKLVVCRMKKNYFGPFWKQYSSSEQV